VTELRHGRVALELHELKRESSGAAPLPLLLLHALGSHAAEWPNDWRSWGGAVYALDFSGHGRSGHITGGGYYPELWVADADLALREIGDRIALVGSGAGAYVALLLSGARPEHISCTLLLAGRGLHGGGAVPDFGRAPASLEQFQAAQGVQSASYSRLTDPWVYYCETDLRPVDYAADFARASARLLLSDTVEAAPPWWEQIRAVACTERAPRAFAAALALLERRCLEPS